MADYIDRQAAIDAIERSGLTDDPCDTAIRLVECIDAADISEELENAYAHGYTAAEAEVHSRDMVEVVRCRDCKHNPNVTWFECPIANLPYKEDRWCWKGERKDGVDSRSGNT